MLLLRMLCDCVQSFLPKKGYESLVVVLIEPTNKVFRQTIQDTEVLADGSLGHAEMLSDLLVTHDIIAVQK